MSSHAISSSDKLPASLTGKLRALRRQIALWFTVDGLNRLLLTALGIIGLDLAIDWYFRMDKAQRGIMLLLALMLLVWVAWRYLVRPLIARRKLTDEALCLEVEQRDRGLSEALISALEFSRADWSQKPNVAMGMVKATIAEGAAASESISINGIIRKQRFWWNALGLVVLIGISVAVAVACVSNKTMSTWLNRNVLLGNAVWPEDFYFDVQGAEGQRVSIPRGDDWPLIAKIREGYRYLPKAVKIEFRSSAGTRVESMNGDDEGKVFRHQMISVTEPVQFRLKSAGVKSDWYQIGLLNRPELTSVSLLTTPPSYTGVGETVLPAGQGPYYILKGSTITVTGEANKPLTGAQLVLGEQRIDLRVADNTFAGTASSDQLISGTYQVEVQDGEQIQLPGATVVSGLGTREPLKFKVRLKDDEKPKVKAVLKGVSGMVVARARLPYQATISDDFSIEQLQLHWQWRQDNSETQDASGEVMPPGAIAQLKKSVMSLTEAFELEPLDIEDGSRLSLQLKATDNNSESGPSMGESTDMIVRVVSEAELRDDLLRREKDQRQLFTEMLDQQDVLLTECQALQALTRDEAALTAEQRGNVVRFQKRQKLLGSGLKPMIERFSNMVEEIRNNRLEEPKGVLQTRLIEKIIEPLKSVQQEHIVLAADALDGVRRRTQLAERQQAFANATGSQKRALKLMRKVLVHMVKNEGYQQAVNLLYEIQKTQEELRSRTEVEKAKLLDPLLKDGATTAPPTNPDQP
jgi:hypothetical protein